ncbi:hypothetical protein [Pyxidicoccus sp. MSG2]|uniref:hypothetical protein n=1 Tax=Pyxidicoccus sp. MSG2 TaxID=2996790 RepID=UPI00226D8F71|nr:hypothetical protein [Pyxidicoccus sp. MSG2]MCY1016975.1 hypothetical protein [Pyxidicoccus sp. MSG2]
MRKLVHLLFNEYRWFRPVHFGRARMVGRLDAADQDYSALLTYFEEFQNITITAHTDRDYVMVFPAKNAAQPFAGKLIWGTSITEAKKPGWRGAHLNQVAEVMKLLDSPLAQTGMADDMDRKTLRLVPSPDGFGSIETFTVRDPSEGLAGLYWRNFFGPPFVRLFGDHLLSLPPDTVQELGGGRILVQPYALPTQVMTPEGNAAEQRLITVLGPECFYDHSRHRKPTRCPELSLPTP